MFYSLRFLRRAVALHVAAASLLGFVRVVAAQVPTAGAPAQGATAPPATSASSADGDLELGARTLRRDVARVVSNEEGAGWFVDAAAYRETINAALESVCSASPPIRKLALDQLEATVTPGTAKALFSRSGQMTSQVEQALTAERQLLTFRGAFERAAECPFFVRPSPSFRGLQSESHKWALHMEGGGLAQIRRTTKQVSLGGGGAGRLLLGRGFERLSVLVGLEAGGGIGLQSEDDSRRLPLTYNGAVPVVLRLRGYSWLYDAELAPLVAMDGESLRVRWGGRFGLGLGIAGLKTRGFLPWAGVFLSADHYFPGDGKRAAQLLRAGVRVGVRWLP